MTRSFLKLLMAASALVPVAATAQRAPDAQVEGRGQWGQRGGDRGARADRQQQQAQPAPQQQQVQQQRAVADTPQVRRDDGRGGRRNGRAEGQRGYAGRDGAQVRATAGRDDRAAQGYSGQNYRGQTYRGQTYREPARYQSRGNDRSQYRAGYDNRQAYTRGYGGSSWNRGWRSDNRYAWSDYRASNRGAYRLPRYYAPGGWSGGYRRFGVGFTLSDILFDQDYWIQDPYSYRLPEAYGPYQWVRYYNDALLVDLDSGRVVDTVYDIFW